MKRDTINYTVVGLFVLVVGAAAAYSIARISGKSGPVDHYYVHYADVAGLKYGTPVFYQGYQIGQVEGVEPRHLESGVDYRVDLSVQDDWPIPDDSIARIFASGLLSAKSINIRQGESPNRLSPGDEINGEPELSMMASINNAADNFSLLAGNLAPTLKRLEDNVNGLITDMRRVTNEDLSPLLTRAEARVDSPEIFAKAEHLLDQLNVSARQLQGFLSEEKSAQLGRFLSNLEQVSSNVNDLVGRLESSRQQLDVVLSEVQGLAGDNRDNLHKAINSLRHNMETIERHIEAVSYNLEGSTRNIHEFTRQIRENPGLLLGSSPQSEKGN